MELQTSILQLLHQKNRSINANKQKMNKKIQNHTVQVEMDDSLKKELQKQQQKLEQQRQNHIKLQFYNRMYPRVNKHLTDQTLQFRKLHNRQSFVLEFPQRPFKMPVQFEQPIPINPVPSPEFPPLVKKRKRCRVSQWVYDTMKFVPRTYKYSKSQYGKQRSQRQSYSADRRYKEKQNVSQRQKLIKRKFRKTIKKTISNLKYLDKPMGQVTIDLQIIKTKMFKQKPYQREKSRQFFKAVKTNDNEMILNMLAQDPFFVYDKDQNYMRPIHWASKLGYHKILQLLIQNKTLINQSDNFGRTPIFLAVKQGHKKIIEMLMIQGARIDIPNKERKLPVDVAPSYYFRFIVQKLQQLRNFSVIKKQSKSILKQKIQKLVKMYFNS